MSRLTAFLRLNFNRCHETVSQPTASQPLSKPLSQPLLLLHIPKTAGTSLRTMLQDSLGEESVFPSHAELVSNQGLYLSEAEVIRSFPSIRPHQVLAGHFFASIADHLPRHYRLVTFLRDPVQRSLSLLAHFYKTTGSHPRKLLKNRQFVTERLADQQTRLLGMHPGDSACDLDQMLERALQAVRIIDFVGLTERFSASCRLFDKRFGTRIVAVERKTNVLRPSGREYEELIPHLEPLIQRDRILYAAAVARFEKELRRTASDSARASDREYQPARAA